MWIDINISYDYNSKQQTLSSMDNEYFYHEGNQQSKLTFKSSPYKAFQSKSNEMIFVKKQKQPLQSYRSSQLLLEESFQNIKSQSNDSAKLDYLISMKNQSKEEIVELNKEVKSLKNKLKICQRKINRSLKKNQYIEASLRKIKKSVKNQSLRNETRNSRQEEIEDRYLDLGKFVRKNPNRRENTLPNDLVSADRTKHSQNQTIAREQITPKVMIKKISDYFDPTQRKMQKSDKLKLKSKKNNKKQIKSLKAELDALIYKELKAVGKEQKKAIKKEIKWVSQKLDELEMGRQKTKCKCKYKASGQLFKN